MKLNTNQKGFTLVELLIVIVVIAILAAISIVAYNGVQNRARTTTAREAASTVVKKAALYQTDNTSYAADGSVLTGLAQNDPAHIPSGDVTFVSTAIAAAPTSPNTVTYATCVTGGTVTGVEVSHWDYTDNSVQALSTGDTSGTCTIQ